MKNSLDFALWKVFIQIMSPYLQLKNRVNIMMLARCKILPNLKPMPKAIMIDLF